MTKATRAKNQKPKTKTKELQKNYKLKTKDIRNINQRLKAQEMQTEHLGHNIHKPKA